MLHGDHPCWRSTRKLRSSFRRCRWSGTKVSCRFVLWYKTHSNNTIQVRARLVAKVYMGFLKLSPGAKVLHSFSLWSRMSSPRSPLSSLPPTWQTEMRCCKAKSKSPSALTEDSLRISVQDSQSLLSLPSQSQQSSGNDSHQTHQESPLRDHLSVLRVGLHSEKV